LLISINFFAQNSFLNCLQNKKENSKESILVFYKPDCPYCEKMQDQISSDIELQQAIKNKYNVALVDITTTEGKQIANLYVVKAVPTIVTYDSKNFITENIKGFGSTKRIAQLLNLNFKDTNTNKNLALAPVCGNAIKESGEGCDDGNLVNGDGCSSVCLIEINSTCGNGIIESGETCDDGNLISGDGCSPFCSLESTQKCGNGIVETPETCDDGNTVANDGCSPFCSIESTAKCGNGIVETPETCDDGNTVANDGCSPFCSIESTAKCGNGIVETPETCDDGNTVANDGCSPFCTTESTVKCGNGIVEAPETCDDGNTVANDGCSPFCTKETLGINENNIQFTTLSTYPNPFVDKISTSLYLLHNSDIEFSVFDVVGKRVSNHKKNNLSFGKNEIVLDVSSLLGSGNYFLEIKVTNQLGTSKEVKKIIKQ
jgi:cysteine-rich repeat protein